MLTDRVGGVKRVDWLFELGEFGAASGRLETPMKGGGPRWQHWTLWRLVAVVVETLPAPDS
jgi:hypothetical protein